MGFLSADRERKLREEVMHLRQEIHELHHVAHLLCAALSTDTDDPQYQEILYTALDAYAKHNAPGITGT